MKPIPNYPNYSITQDGKVWSHKNRKFLSSAFVGRGYKKLTLCNELGKKQFLVHRLVAITYLNNPENKAQINHINGIKTDNRVENLEWITAGDNNLHAFKMGLKEANIKASKLNVKKATEASKKIVLDTNTGIFYNSTREASAILGIKIHNLYKYLTNGCKNKTSLIYV
jgi:hypothetical protein